MNTKLTIVFFTLVTFLSFSRLNAQITERERPKEWNNLVQGGRFMDRFLPIPTIGNLTKDTWGADDVVPRFVDNGIEDADWSYWGGNSILGDDGNYHLFVCRWAEDSPKGHMQWSESIVVHAVSGTSYGPYKVVETIGPGHNPEVFQLADGRYIIYVIDGHYIADELKGPWIHGKFDFDKRDRRIIEGLSNLSFAQREDGSYLMVCRGGGIWLSKNGLSTYYQVSNERVYPPVDGRFEDPLVWRTNVQYHMIVNDWLGRIAWYLRSKDGISWKVEPGEAYMPGLAKYEDGTVVDWFKYERIKVLQDKYGRATQANFAVIDTIKWDDKSNDNHSSKNITIPLTVGKLLSVQGKNKIDKETKSIRVKVEAEEGFNPQSDIDLSSLRFGASEEVNFGRGAEVIGTENYKGDLIITFGLEHGLTDLNFAGKMLGKTKKGNLLFAYCRLPEINYKEPYLSARKPEFITDENGFVAKVEMQNFGQVASKPSTLKIQYIIDDKTIEIASARIPKIDPFEKMEIKLNGKSVVNGQIEKAIQLISISDGKQQVVYKESSKSKE